MEAANLQKQDLEGKDFISLDKQVDSKSKLMERISEFSLSICEDCGLIFDAARGGITDNHYSSCSYCVAINTLS